MGVSTNAILFWGYTWKDEETRRPWTIGKDCSDDEEDEEDEEDWEDRYAAAMGLERYDEEATEKQRDQYWNAKQKLIEKSSCLVDTHCSCDFPMPYVAIAKSRILAHRGYPVKFEPEKLVVGEKWLEEINAFCRLMAIPIPRSAPRWYLVSDGC